MEPIFSRFFDMSLIVGVFVKILLVMMTIMSLIMVRQASLMDRVVNVPIGSWFKGVTLLFMLLCVAVTLMTILVL